MITCKQAVKKIHQKRDGAEPLSLRQHLGLGFHLMICVACRAYFKQMELIQWGAKKMSDKKAMDDTEIKRIEDGILDRLPKD
jgi:predicted anti-sigma-YlaC factor YlaD